MLLSCCVVCSIMLYSILYVVVVFCWALGEREKRKRIMIDVQYHSSTSVRYSKEYSTPSGINSTVFLLLLKLLLI